jgi:hypothetical protein
MSTRKQRAKEQEIAIDIRQPNTNSPKQSYTVSIF